MNRERIKYATLSDIENLSRLQGWKPEDIKIMDEEELRESADII